MTKHTQSLVNTSKPIQSPVKSNLAFHVTKDTSYVSFGVYGVGRRVFKGFNDPVYKKDDAKDIQDTEMADAMDLNRGVKRSPLTESPEGKKKQRGLY